MNIILDSIGGHIWEKNVSCLATDGRWVLYGTMGGTAVKGDLLGKLLSKRGHLHSSLLRSRSLQVRRNTSIIASVPSPLGLCLMGPPFLFTVQSRPGDGILAEGPTTFLRVSETSD